VGDFLIVPWYESNRRLFREESSALTTGCPLLNIAVVDPDFTINSVCSTKAHCAVVYGTYRLHIPCTDRCIDYGIVLVLPNDYPKSPPDLYCNDPKLPIGDVDRHIMPDGSACLAVQAELRMRWPPGSNIVNFLENLVAPFLVWHAYYDQHHTAPPWGEPSHSAKGILELYAELLGDMSESCLIGFMRLLARKNQPKGHELCPCNSGQRLRDCHRELVQNARSRVAWRDVMFDLTYISKAHESEQRAEV
jgi:hypothetical protein